MNVGQIKIYSTIDLFVVLYGCKTLLREVHRLRVFKNREDFYV
jgi:hypothetical protein